METFVENLAGELIKKAAYVSVPGNPLGMSDYYNTKIKHLRDAIILLEVQIREYEKECNKWREYEERDKNAL